MTAIVQYSKYSEAVLTITALSDTRESLGDFVLTDERLKTKAFENYIVSGSGDSTTFNLALKTLRLHPVIPTDNILESLAFLERIHHLLFRVLAQSSTGQLHFATPSGMYTVQDSGVQLDDTRQAVHGSCYDKIIVALKSNRGTVLDAFKEAISLDIYCSDKTYTEVSIEVPHNCKVGETTYDMLRQSPVMSAMGVRS